MALRPFSWFCLMIMLLAGGSFAASPETIDIPYKKVVLGNGLTVIVHEDHKAPIVAVNVWYHVGSRNERLGKTGFAHLFEHLMFNGSEHFNDDFFKALDKVGGTNYNGTTGPDRTNYFENVPVSALDTVLWLESERMGYMLPAIDQARLDEQRGVVQNERRQYENQPYGLRAEEALFKTCFPPDHPYAHTVIGEMDDLSSATLADVQGWFKSYYGPSNAVLVVAGDVRTSDTIEKVKRYFGSFPPGPPVARHTAWVPRHSGSVRQIMQDRVPQTRILMAWTAPQWGTTDSTCLDFAANLLAGGKNTRLYKRLVRDEQIATDVQAENMSMEISGLFAIVAMVKPGVDPARVEASLADELQEFLEDGPSRRGLELVRTRFLSDFVRGIEQVGGFRGKANLLAEGQTYAGDPAFYKAYYKQLDEATPRQVRAVARQWLSDGAYIQRVDPFPKMRATAGDVDRSKIPGADTPADARFPKLQRATLSNGLKVVFAERDSVPLVRMSLILDSGTVADPPDKSGVANLTLGMMREGTKKRTAEEISDQTDMLGMDYSFSSNDEFVGADMSVLAQNLDPALDLFADIILNPAFKKATFDRKKQEELAGIQQLKADPRMAAARIMPRLVYGADHPYGEFVTEDSVKRIALDDLVQYHRAWFKPGNATIVVVGDTHLEEITAKLEKAFRRWPNGETAKKPISAAKPPAGPAIYLIDKPQAEQSVVLAARLAPPKSNPEEIAIETMNQILGGQFSSRINMNLRENKHWSYGARSRFSAGRVQRLFTVEAPVQSDKTRETLLEIRKELAGIVSAQPVTEDEFGKAKLNKTLRLPGNWETTSAVCGSIKSIVCNGLPDDYNQAYPRKVRELTLEQVRSAARTVVGANEFVWVVVGDRARIEKELQTLDANDFGRLQIIDADGNGQ
ncbi:MAG: pitrilysin family protein [Candidatus Sumerlaeia bacterium]